MRRSLPLIAAILAGASVLGAALFAVLYRVPAVLGSDPGLELVLQGLTPEEDGLGLSPGFVTAVIVFMSLAGLTILFFIEVLNPKTQRRRQTSTRGVTDLLDALQQSDRR